jgi:hypothetical protein
MRSSLGHMYHNRSSVARLIDVGASGNHSIQGRVDPRAGLDNVEKRKFFILPGLELRPIGRPARILSLYRLSYPGSQNILVAL